MIIELESNFSQWCKELPVGGAELSVRGAIELS